MTAPHLRVGARVVVSDSTLACHGDRGSVESVGTRIHHLRRAPVYVVFDDGSEECFWHHELRTVGVVDALAELA